MALKCRENTVQQLEQQYVAGDERSRMLEILQRLHSADAAELAEIEAHEVESEDEAGSESDPGLSTELLHKLSMMASIMHVPHMHSVVTLHHSTVKQVWAGHDHDIFAE